MVFEERSFPSTLIALDSWDEEIVLAAGTATAANGHILSYESEGQRLRAEWSCEFGCWVSWSPYSIILLVGPDQVATGMDIVFYLLILRIFSI